MPDLISILLLGIVLLLSLRILDYARRVVMFWIMLLLRCIFWASVLGGAYYVYVVGVEKAGREAGWFVGVVWGFVEDLVARSHQQDQHQSGGYGASFGGQRGSAKRMGW